ncbi:MAG: NAD(P)H-dependent oxidoreductase [bacterium]
MQDILYIRSSPRGADSISGQIADELVTRLMEQQPGASLKLRDLATQPVPHIDALFASGTLKPAEQRSAAEVDALRLSDGLLEEVRQAQHIVVAAAMVNFSIPSTLKAWIDQLMRLGLAFHYTAEGPAGLLGGRRLYLVLARGSAYGPGREDWDFQQSYLRKIFGFMGIDEQQLILIEPTLAGEDRAAEALARARERIAEITAQARAEA